MSAANATFRRGYYAFPGRAALKGVSSLMQGCAEDLPEYPFSRACKSHLRRRMTASRHGYDRKTLIVQRPDGEAFRRPICAEFPSAKVPLLRKGCIRLQALYPQPGEFVRVVCRRKQKRTARNSGLGRTDEELPAHRHVTAREFTLAPTNLTSSRKVRVAFQSEDEGRRPVEVGLASLGRPVARRSDVGRRKRRFLFRLSVSLAGLRSTPR